MTDWKDSAQEVSELILRYLRPMVEEAEAQRAERKQREAMADLTGEESGPFGSLNGLPFPAPRIVGMEYMHRPAFPLHIGESDAVMRDDGAVFVYSDEQGAWVQHSALPGTMAARPVDDAAET